MKQRKKVRYMHSNSDALLMRDKDHYVSQFHKRPGLNDQEEDNFVDVSSPNPGKLGGKIG
jgi:hypothetical protein